MRGEPSQPIRPDVQRILREAFPRGRMAPAFDIQTSHLADVFPRLKARLLGLDGAAVAYERDPFGGAGWSAGEGRLPAGPGAADAEDQPSSYYLFFLAAALAPHPIGGGEVLRAGYTVALSVMAPMALVVLNHLDEDEDGSSHSMPDIVPEEVDMEDGEAMEIGRFCREVLPAAGRAALDRLRREITATLAELGFEELPEEERGKPVPWLQVPGMPAAAPGRLTVRDALFFWTP